MLAMWVVTLLIMACLLHESDCHGGNQHHKSPFLAKTKAMSFIPENHWLHRRNAVLCRDDEEYCERSPGICMYYVEPSREVICGPNSCSPGYTCYLAVPCRKHFGAGCSENACLGMPCKNGATCQRRLGSNFVCSCTPGFYGQVCEYVDSCLSAPCLNGGSCNRVASSFNCTCPNRYNGSTCESDCRPGPVDILFIMDSSYSTEKHFNESKASATAIVNKLSLGADDFLVAVITYSFDVTVEFTLNQFTDKASVISAVNNLTGTRGPSYLDKALTKSKDIFSATYGARTSVRKYIIIISDGLANQREKAKYGAWALKSQGIRIFAIGNGEQVDQTELLQLATAQQYVFPAGREDDVTNTILIETVSSYCTDCSLHKMTDILFLVDVSQSQKSLQLTLDALTDLEDKVLNNNSDIHVGMATFDLTVQSKFPLNYYKDRNDIIINSQIGIATTNRKSNISAALAFARHTGFTGSRSDARKMLVVFTNEGWTELDDIRQQREALNMVSVTVVFVTTGQDADLDIAYSVAERASHVYYIENHNDFERSNALVAQTAHVECPGNIFDIRK